MAQLDRATGSFLGACIGDAAGGVLEIPLSNGIDPDRVEWALSMPGGGAHRLGPGQVTDDSEMAICLAHSLASNPPPEYPADAVAIMYAQWLDSRPFSIGRTIRTSCSGALEALRSGKEVARSMAAAAAKANSWSQANGALMRILPLAIWGHRLSDEELAFCAHQDAILSHPHENCQACNAIYCIAIAHLVQEPGNADAAVAAVRAYAEGHAPPDVTGWLDDALSDRPLGPVTQAGNAGWVRHAFVHAFRHLRLRSSYETALRDILSQGGDTDTNAAIVGGLVGALHGAEAIPAALKEPVLARDALSRGNPKFPRPPFLHTKQVPSLCQQLLDASVSAAPIKLVTPEKTTSR